MQQKSGIQGPAEKTVRLARARWPRIGERIVSARTRHGAVIFVSEDCSHELFVARGESIRALSRGTWHLQGGVSLLLPIREWRVRVERGAFRRSAPTFMLDSFDASWKRTTIPLNELITGQLFVYEG